MGSEGCTGIGGKGGTGRGNQRVIIEGYGREGGGLGRDTRREVPQMMRRLVK